MNNKSIDINSILIGMNLLVMGMMLAVLGHTEGNHYTNEGTIWLGMLLCIQTHVALWLERRQRDPFMILLASTMILYYSLRIVTLAVYDYSVVFERFPYDAHDSNYALVFIIVANAFLFGGLRWAGRGADRIAEVGAWRARAPGRVIVVMVVAIFFAYWGSGDPTQADVPRLVSILGIFIAQHIIMLMALSYYFLFRQSLSRQVSMAIGLLVLADMVMHTLVGSRGAIAGLLQQLMLVVLAISGSIRVQRRYLAWAVALLPLVALAVVASFTIGTYNRAHRELGAPLDLGRALELASTSSSELTLGASLDVVLPPVFNRAGFFDYSAEIIAHRDRYAAVLNIASYGRSIVDNVLTPGFDVYDQPKVANALEFTYNELGKPSKALVSELYQSDQLGIYGEFYALFGYASLPLFFATTLLFKRIYLTLRSVNPYTFVMKRVMVLYIFGRFVDSFGIDWTIIEALELAVTVFLYSFFFSSRRAGAAPVAAAAPAAGALPG
jgi:hypothetical protein